jgi:hydrogenase nickel incorporation protein HypA/HybF
MHELSIAYGVLEQVKNLAQQHGAQKVEAVELEIGILAQVFPESLQAAFEMVCEGGVAEGAKLKMLVKNARVHCLQCDGQFESDGTNFACPTCHQARTEVTGGDEILLTAITFQDGEE